MLSRLPRWSIALLCLVAAAPTTQPTDQQTLLASIQSEADRHAALINQWPRIEQQKIKDVLVLDFDGPVLSPRTLLTRTMQERSFTIEGMPGICGAVLNFNRAGQPRRFRFERLDDSDPNAPLIYTDLVALPQQVNIMYTRESLSLTYMITLVDDRTKNDPTPRNPDGECRLYIEILDGRTDSPLVNAHIIEGDLATIIRTHRISADLYLRPMLCELGQEYLMLPDLHIARQVLTEPGNTDAATAQRIQDLVNHLGSDDFSKRQSADKELQQMDTLAAPTLMQLQTGKLTAEQRNRIDALLRRVHPIPTADAEKLATDKAFLIDCLELNDLAVRAQALAKLQSLTGNKMTLDAKASGTDRAASAIQLRARYLPPPDHMPPDATPSNPGPSRP